LPQSASTIRRATLRDHEKIVAAIEAGTSSQHETVKANLVGGVGLTAARQAGR
jgi:DNA-binding FadR family transcriptional regulator